MPSTLMPLGLQNLRMTLYVLTKFIYLWRKTDLRDRILLDSSTIGLEFEGLQVLYT